MKAVSRPFFFDWIAGVGGFFGFVMDFVSATIRHGVSPRRVLQEAYEIGVKSLPILIVISVFVGTNLALQGFHAFKPLGGQRLVGMFVALAGVRELGPIITAAMVAAKAGTEMSSQIGVMRIREQIDALEVMAVNPMAWLIAPRCLGIVLVLPALTILSIFMMVAAAYATSVWQLELNGRVFMEFVGQGVSLADFAYGVVKSFVFAMIICMVSCWCGFHCESGPTGVGRATNRAVVYSAVVCMTVNYFLSEMLYGGVSS